MEPKRIGQSQCRTLFYFDNCQVGHALPYLASCTCEPCFSCLMNSSDGRMDEASEVVDSGLIPSQAKPKSGQVLAFTASLLDAQHTALKG